MTHTIVGFGASSMQGAGDTQGGFLLRARRLAPKLAHNWINCGVGGNTTRDMLLRVSAVTEHAPYHLIVLLGCNDMPRTGDQHPEHRTSLPEFGDNLQRLLSAIAGTTSLFITSFPVSPRIGLADDVFESYMGRAVEIAHANQYKVWDLYAKLKGRVQPYWAPDGAHLNDEGHSYIARRLIESWL